MWSAAARQSVAPSERAPAQQELCLRSEPLELVNSEKAYPLSAKSIPPLVAFLIKSTVPRPRKGIPQPKPIEIVRYMRNMKAAFSAKQSKPPITLEFSTGNFREFETGLILRRPLSGSKRVF